jgi:hypothetical protein
MPAQEGAQDKAGSTSGTILTNRRYVAMRLARMVRKHVLVARGLGRGASSADSL